MNQPRTLPRTKWVIIDGHTTRPAPCLAIEARRAAKTGRTITLRPGGIR